MKIPSYLLIDVMIKDKFVCQLRYTGKPFPSVVGGG